MQRVKYLKSSYWPVVSDFRLFFLRKSLKSAKKVVGVKLLSTFAAAFERNELNLTS